MQPYQTLHRFQWLDTFRELNENKMLDSGEWGESNGIAIPFTLGFFSMDELRAEWFGLKSTILQL